MNYLIDLDGTLIAHGCLVNGANTFIETLKRNNKKFLIMTNSIRSPAIIVERLLKLGMKVPEDKILNPIVSINKYLLENNFSKAFIVGSKQEKEQIKIKFESEKPEIIVLLDFEKINADYNLLQKVYELSENGIEIISASYSDYYFKDGKKTLDTGSFVKLLEAATSKNIKIFGKPSKDYFQIGIDLLGSSPENVTIIGDDIKTDIEGAKKSGINSILMKTGKYKSGDEKIVVPGLLVRDFEEIEFFNKNI